MISLSWWGAAAREEMCAWSVCRSLNGWFDVSMHHAMARLIFLDAGFFPDFAAGPQSHIWAAVLALFPAQVRGPSGLARVLPRSDGIVQTGSGAWAFAAAVLILLHG